MNNIWQEIGKPFLKRWLLAPFSNKVTKALLFTGGAVVAAPLIEHLIIKVVLLKIFDIDLPIDVPDVPAYIAGVSLMLIGALHNLGQLYFEKFSMEQKNLNIKEAQKSQIPHDKKIIDELLSLLPYENTHCWLEQASYAGLRRDFVHDLDKCEKFVTPPYTLYNQEVEQRKQQLVASIKSFNDHCSGHLGAQEDKSGKMYLPPFHWKSQGKESEERYYAQVSDVSKSGQEVKSNLDHFIESIKNEGFIVEEI